MNKISGSTAAKATAIFLVAVLSVVFLLSTLAIIFMSEEDVYFDDGSGLRYSIYSSVMYDAQIEIMDYVRNALEGDAWHQSQREYIMDKYSSRNSNIFFTVSDSRGTVIFTNYSELNYRFESQSDQIVNVSGEIKSLNEEESSLSMFDVKPNATEEGDRVAVLYPYQNKIETDNASSGALVVSAADGGSEFSTEIEAVTEQTVTFKGYIREELTAKDRLYYMLGIAEFFITQRYAVVAVCILSFVMCVALFVFLMCSAGHRKGTEEICLNPLDKIPFDIYFVFILTMISIICYTSFFVLFNFYSVDLIFRGAATIGGLVTAELLLLSLFLTFATRVKFGRWWKNTLVFKILYLMYRMAKWVLKKISLLFKSISMFWKTAIAFTVLSLFEAVVILSASRGSILMWWFVEKVILGSFLFYLLADLKRIEKGAEIIAGGNTEHRIETKNLFGDFKKHANALNSISDGMQKAVNDKMKSERFKTELITNVSHDLKTPLTSIINYVDLMKKEEIEPPKAREYLEVLDRQSKRLQKLTVDLLEASKASTGNIAVNAEKTDVGVFLSQLSGEYAEKLAENNLELIVTCSQENLYIIADGRLLWRVFDNLMSNICKYAQPETRVYVSAETVNSWVEITFKNISKFPLNISSDELMERFVRGDQSRNTEGSGLGLSIARSLTELQKGQFALVVDGDLFKAIVKFEQYKEPEEENL